MCMLAAAQISSAETVFVVSPDTLHTLLAVTTSHTLSIFLSIYLLTLSLSKFSTDYSIIPLLGHEQTLQHYV